MFAPRSREYPLFIDPVGDYAQVVGWRKYVNIISSADNSPERMSALLIGEIFETKEEREKLDSTPKQEEIPTIRKNYLSETTDIAVFFHALASKVLKGPADHHDALRLTNGMGRRSDVYDRMVEIAGNLPTRQSDGERLRSFNWFEAYWISLFSHGPFAMDGRYSMQKVIDKNRRNYPVRVFHDPHQRDPELLPVMYDERAFLMKLIRRNIKERGRERPLRPTDYEPHLDLILSPAPLEIRLPMLQQRLVN